jgi:hypothetical protein
MGGQRGTVSEIELRGSGLEGAYAIWLGADSEVVGKARKLVPGSRGEVEYARSGDGLEAHVDAVVGGSSAKVRLVIGPRARIGFHTLALISPGGISEAVTFWVGDHAILADNGVPHRTPASAQAVKLPVAVNGRISESGQLAYYAFEIAREQTVAFEVIATHGAGFDPQLALYEAGGSFLDPERSKRLVFHEEVTQGGMPANRRLTYHFTKPGRYLVNLSNLFTQGGGEFSFLLRMVPVQQAANSQDALSWARGRVRDLCVRTVATPAMDFGLLREMEPNDNPQQAQVFHVPAVLEGTIGRAGDLDRFRFKAKAGQKLVFEIHTPRAAQPHFNPRLDILDAKGAVVLTNIQVQDGKVGTEAGKVIQVASQVMGKLDGEYSLRIRDLTSVHGSPDHVYWVLVRPQIPHIGDIQVQPGGPLNLVAGTRQRLTLKPSWQEGYAGSLALSVEGLPPAVRAFVGANGSLIELVADASAPRTRMPSTLRIWGLALDGKAGSSFLVSETPTMVVKK